MQIWPLNHHKGTKSFEGNYISSDQAKFHWTKILNLVTNTPTDNIQVDIPINCHPWYSKQNSNFSPGEWEWCKVLQLLFTNIKAWTPTSSSPFLHSSFVRKPSQVARFKNFFVTLPGEWEWCKVLQLAHRVFKASTRSCNNVRCWSNIGSSSSSRWGRFPPCRWSSKVEHVWMQISSLSRTSQLPVETRRLLQSTYSSCS